MAKLNKSWAILVREKIAGNSKYYRNFDKNVYKPDLKYDQLLDILMPYAPDDHVGRSKGAEDLLQLVLTSQLRDTLLEMDSNNTYEKSKMLFPSPGTVDTSSAIHVNYNPKSDNFGSLNVQGQAIGGIVTYLSTSSNASEPDAGYVIVNSLSNDLPIFSSDPGFYYRFKEDPNGKFSFIVYGDPKIEYNKILSDLDSYKVQQVFNDNDLREIYMNEDNWVDRLSSVVILILQNLTK